MESFSNITENDKFREKLRQYGGTNMSMFFVPDDKRMKELLSAKVYDDDIWIVTYPKSGTTWMQALVSLVCAIPSEDNQDFKHPLIDPDSFLEYRSRHFDVFPIIQNAPRPRQVKTHLPYHLLPAGLHGPNPPKLIYVARDAKDVCVSMYHFIKKVRHWDYNGSFSDFYELFINGQVLYGSWLSHVEDYWMQQDRGNVLFVTYEEMTQDLASVVSRVTEFLDRPSLTPQQMSEILPKLQFENLKNDKFFDLTIEQHGLSIAKETLMRKGIVGDWKNYMNGEMSSELESRFLKPLKELGLAFD